MDALSLLIFELDGARFGLDATQVRECIWLPELTPAEEAPPWIVGLFNLRGRIEPVADLRLRFGHPARDYRPGDQVVVVETDGRPMGLIVDDVIEVIDLPGESIQPPPQFDAASPAPDHLVAGEARVGDGLVTLLDISRLIQLTEWPGPAAAAQQRDEPAPVGGFCPRATAAEHELFRARAAALREAIVEEDSSRLGLAVMQLDAEYFGVELASVQEFCEIAQLSPIPCCPPHILGAMNLRGNLLTLIDPRAALNLPPAPRGGKAVVARLGDQTVGIAVDEVHDVIYLRSEDLQPPPALLRESCGAEFSGTAAYAGRIITVLDLPALLAREDWIVDQHV
ncbi:MAG: chemotaxis protein CheW [Sulfuritalea sp.]